MHDYEIEVLRPVVHKIKAQSMDDALEKHKKKFPNQIIHSAHEVGYVILDIQVHVQEAHMTDREHVLALARKLKLEISENHDAIYHDYDCVIDNEENSVTFGSGKGYSGFSVTFFFDAEGNIISHGVWE